MATDVARASPRRAPYEEATAVANVILEHNHARRPGDGWRGEAYGGLIRARFDDRYRLPILIPEPLGPTMAAPAAQTTRCSPPRGARLGAGRGFRAALAGSPPPSRTRFVKQAQVRPAAAGGKPMLMNMIEDRGKRRGEGAVAAAPPAFCPWPVPAHRPIGYAAGMTSRLCRRGPVNATIERLQCDGCDITVRSRAKKGRAAWSAELSAWVSGIRLLVESGQ